MDIVQEVEPEQDLRRLKRGLHFQVLIPGVPTMELFKILKALRQSSTPGLNQIDLYPEIDCYDLRLEFSDRTLWAVDVKDVPKASNLKGLTRLNGTGSLQYDEGFYVVPQVYLERDKQYLMSACASSDLQGMQLMGSDSFEAKVEGKIKQLRRETKK